MKWCPGCESDQKEFGSNKSRTDGLQPYCKACSKKKKGSYYQANKKKMRIQIATAMKIRRSENNRLLVLYLEKHPCVDCGEKDIEVLDCDHVRGKKIGNVVDLIKRNFSWSKIEEELSKCETRCANCHRRKTNRQFGYTRRVAS
jgi:hypothetical protein